MFLRKPGSRWARTGGGLTTVVDEVFAPHRHEVLLREEARKAIPQERLDSDPDRR
jgi:hypothetical protein